MMADQPPPPVEPSADEPRPSQPTKRNRPFPFRVSPFLALLLVGAAVAVFYVSALERHTGISYHEFQRRYWNERSSEYRGLAAAKLRDDLLLVKPAEEFSFQALWEPKRERSPKDPWLAIRLPATAIDGEMIQRLGTIPGFTVEPSDALLRWTMYATVQLIVTALLFYVMVLRPLRAQGGPGNVLAFGRSRPRIVGKEHTGVRFDDVAGIDEAKAEVKEVIEFLRNPSKFTEIGGRIPRGILFVGPPGAGKTLLAKAIAGEADAPFYSISGSDFVEMYVGVGASRVRDLFRQAKETAPCIVFLDEVDAVGRRRGSGVGGGHDEREQTLNAILVEMDGFDTNENVIVIAATNRPDTLDPALLRPGRFDREVVISLPDVKGRYEILRVHARHVKLADDVDLHRVARATPMFSGAELEALINEAAIRAAMAERKQVTQLDLEEARDKVRYGRENRSMSGDDRDLRETAYHEAGHAILVRTTPHVEPLHKVTIIPRGRSLGATMILPEKDRRSYSRNQLLGQIEVCFGGRIAEELCLDDVSSGALQDIQQATSIARRMVCDFGMSRLGPVHFAEREQQSFLGGDLPAPREYSEATAERIDAEIGRIIEEAYSNAKRRLESRLDQLHILANALLVRETLTAEEVDALLKAA
jgi:cell division protease FtsH